MKKLLTVAMSLMLAVSMFAQKDVTKFLGIPVDGTKAEMIRKLKAKGFKSTSYDKDELKGQFNGYNVNIRVVTNNNKVWRIVVLDSYGVNETSIKIRFNNLCKQFEENPNYMSFEQSIPEDEQISYEMIINKKRYEAAFYQHNRDSIYKQANAHLNVNYTDEEILNPTEKMRAEFSEYVETLLEQAKYKSVWFCIQELSYDKYRIVMYYDNEYNKANGEDL